MFFKNTADPIVHEKFECVFEILGRNQIYTDNSFVEKLLDSIGETRDINLLKCFLMHVKVQLNTLYQLIITHSWDTLKESLLKKSLEPKFENISNSCALIKVIAT